MLFKLPFRDSETSWSQRCGLRLRSSYKSAVLPNALAVSAASAPQRVGRVGCVGLECIQRPMEHFFNAPETNWDRVDRLSKESKPILFVFGLVCFWYDSGWYGIQMHSVEVPLGPTNRKKLERTLQDGSFGVCLGDVWNIVTDFIVLARNTSTLYKAQQDSTFCRCTRAGNGAGILFGPGF